MARGPLTKAATPAAEPKAKRKYTKRAAAAPAHHGGGERNKRGMGPRTAPIVKPGTRKLDSSAKAIARRTAYEKLSASKKAELAARSKAYYAKHNEKQREYHKNYSAAYRAAFPERVKKWAANYKAKHAKGSAKTTHRGGTAKPVSTGAKRGRPSTKVKVGEHMGGYKTAHKTSATLAPHAKRGRGRTYLPIKK